MVFGEGHYFPQPALSTTIPVGDGDSCNEFLVADVACLRSPNAWFSLDLYQLLIQ